MMQYIYYSTIQRRRERLYVFAQRHQQRHHHRHRHRHSNQDAAPRPEGESSQVSGHCVCWAFASTELYISQLAPASVGAIPSIFPS